MSKKSPHYQGNLISLRPSKTDYSSVEVGDQQEEMLKVLEDYVKWDGPGELCTRSLCVKPSGHKGGCVKPGG